MNDKGTAGTAFAKLTKLIQPQLNGGETASDEHGDVKTRQAYS
jgi:hypothetical protein